MAQTGIVIVYGAPSPTDPNDIAGSYYGVADISGSTIDVDGTNNATVIDNGAFFPDTPAGVSAANELRGSLMSAQPNRAWMALKVERSTTITYPTGLTPTIEPVPEPEPAPEPEP